MAGQPVRTGGADLAVVVDRGIFRGLDPGGANRTTLWEIASKFMVENAGPVGEHGREISIGMWARQWSHCSRRSKNQTRNVVAALLEAAYP